MTFGASMVVASKMAMATRANNSKAFHDSPADNSSSKTFMDSTFTVADSSHRIFMGSMGADSSRSRIYMGSTVADSSRIFMAITVADSSSRICMGKIVIDNSSRSSCMDSPTDSNRMALMGRMVDSSSMIHMCSSQADHLRKCTITSTIMNLSRTVPTHTAELHHRAYPLLQESTG
jgi:hypothetical protein